MPVFNAEDFLPECLDSVLAQDFNDFEVIAINDGSSDRSADMLNRYAALDSRIKVKNQAHGGLVAALNLSLELAKGEYLARMDADDIMLPRRLMRQVEYLDANLHVDVVACQVALLDATSSTEGLRHYIDWQNNCVQAHDIRNAIYTESPVSHPSVMMRHKVLRDMGGYRDGQFPEDYDLWLRMIQAGYVITKIPETLLRWRDSQMRLSRRDERCSRQAFDNLRAAYLALDARLQQAERLVIWGAGRLSRKRCRLLLDRGYTPEKWIDVDPGKIGNAVDGAMIVEPQWLTDADQQSNRPFILCYVNNHGAKGEMAVFLNKHGYIEGQHYLMVG